MGKAGWEKKIQHRKRHDEKVFAESHVSGTKGHPNV